MSHKQPLTLTIGIAAHNEERSIGTLLDSIRLQEQEGYRLEKVIVACDGCTDKTTEMVRACQETLPGLVLVDDEKRCGKVGRVNQFFRANTSDVFVILDADTKLANQRTLAHLVEAFQDPFVGYVGGGDRPASPKTFFESVAITTVDLWRSMRRAYNGGDTVHNAHGCFLAVSRRFADQVEIPKGFHGEDNFLYFKAKALGFRFRYAENALLWYRETATLRDFVVQRRRFHTIADDMRGYFGNWIDKYYVAMPLSIKTGALLSMFVRRPVRLSLALLLEISMRLYIRIHPPVSTGSTWVPVQSTK